MGGKRAMLKAVCRVAGDILKGLALETWWISPWQEEAYDIVKIRTRVLNNRNVKTLQLLIPPRFPNIVANAYRPGGVVSFGSQI
jgi:hypothetical protein